MTEETPSRLQIFLAEMFGTGLLRIEVAKLYYFDTDPDGAFRRVQRQPTAVQP